MIATFHWKMAATRRARIWNQAIYASAGLASPAPMASAWSTAASQVLAACSPRVEAASFSWAPSASARAARASRVAPVTARSATASARRWAARARATLARVASGSSCQRNTTASAPLAPLYGSLK
jgi:hypothetical protein